MSTIDGLKSYVPYPSGVSIRNRELQITANHPQVGAVLSKVNNFSKASRGIFGATAALIFIIDWQLSVLPMWIKPLYWFTVLILAILAAVRIRVVVTAEPVKVGVSTKVSKEKISPELEESDSQ
ncbi:hypothetical protein [Halosimplex amylolyticum]|uniref:hypothetical protein n=1 Tax=Halosimplex amylolyticum TaxID=3396616 RepID=UPI003F567657